MMVSEEQSLCLTPSAISDRYAEYTSEILKEYNLPAEVYKHIPQNEYSSHEDFDSNFSAGEGEFVAEIDRISDSGNGIIEVQENHINIGPVEFGSTGETVVAKYVNGPFAQCKTEEVKAENYDRKFNHLVSKSTVPSSDDADSIIEICDQCSLLMREKDGKWVCSAGHQKPQSQANTCSHNPQDEQSDEGHGSDTISPKQSRDSFIEEKSDEESTNSDQNSLERLEKLQKAAEENAVENILEDTTTSTQETTQYNRSSKIREYVMARAKGVCEGCGEDAPFTSKTGDPYLHAHHIHELSEGGSDTPGTVIALCPNCHYRVHHGKDGDEYNAELLKIVQETENRA